MKHKHKRKNKIKWFRIMDLLFVLILIILSGAIAFLSLPLSNTYTLLFIVVMVIIIGINISLFLNKKNIVHFFRRSIVLLISASLLFGYGKLKALDQGIQNIFNPAETASTETITYGVYARTSHPDVKKDLEGVEVLRIGYLNKLSVDATFIDDTLDKKVDTVHTYQYVDYDTLLNDYQNYNIDALVLSQEEYANIPKTYNSLFSESYELYAFTQKKDIKNSDQNTIDITNTVFSILISANDELGVPTNKSNSDANMLLTVNPTNHKISIVSIPRDGFIPNVDYDYAYDKLTHTGQTGIKNSVDSLSYALDIKIDFYIKVSFTSFIEIIDILEGIEADVASTFCEQDENRNFGANEICLNVGKQTLNGKQALAYARHRHSYTDQDLGRNQAQTDVIKAIVKKMASLEGIQKAEAILDILPKYVITNFSQIQVKNFIKSQIDDLQAWDIQSFAITGDPSGYEYTASSGYASVLYCSLKTLHQAHMINTYQTNMQPLKKLQFRLSDLYNDDIDENLSNEFLIP
ncbi:MAG: LCP family protein [Breznakia sp.]